MADSYTESDEELKNNLKPDIVEPLPTNDLSPEIPPEGQDDEMKEDQHLSNIDEGDKQINNDVTEHQVKEGKPIIEA